jgi:hypothetical protein
MKKYKLYRYIGRNGEITSPILLEDAKHIPLMELRPEPGYVLTNGEVVRENFVIVHVEEVSEWTEVKADTKD